MSVIADIDHNRAAVATVHRAATAYLAAAEMPMHVAVYSDNLTEDARAQLEGALARLVRADPRDVAACDAAILATRDAMHALDVAIGLAPGAPPLVVRLWHRALRRLTARAEADR